MIDLWLDIALPWVVIFSPPPSLYPNICGSRLLHPIPGLYILLWTNTHILSHGVGGSNRYNLPRIPWDGGGVQASLGKLRGLAQEEEMLLKGGDRCWLESGGGQCGSRSERTTIFPVPLALRWQSWNMAWHSGWSAWVLLFLIPNQQLYHFY